MNYQIQNGQSIFDVVNATVGDLNLTYALVQANNISDISAAPVGLFVAYTPPPVTPPVINSLAPTPSVTAKNYASNNNQTVYDICLQTYTDLNLLYQLIQDSNFTNVLTYPLPGRVFTFNPQLTKDYFLSGYIASNGFVLTTGSTAASSALPTGSIGTDDGEALQTDSGTYITID